MDPDLRISIIESAAFLAVVFFPVIMLVGIVVTGYVWSMLSACLNRFRAK